METDFSKTDRNGQQVHEKRMFTITNHHQNANQNHNEKSPHSNKSDYHKKQKGISVGQAMG